MWIKISFIKKKIVNFTKYIYNSLAISKPDKLVVILMSTFEMKDEDYTFDKYIEDNLFNCWIWDKEYNDFKTDLDYSCFHNWNEFKEIFKIFSNVLKMEKELKPSYKKNK